jgi:hypothetical protein
MNHGCPIESRLSFISVPNPPGPPCQGGACEYAALVSSPEKGRSGGVNQRASWLSQDRYAQHT